MDLTKLIAVELSIIQPTSPPPLRRSALSTRFASPSDQVQSRSFWPPIIICFLFLPSRRHLPTQHVQLQCSTKGPVYGPQALPGCHEDRALSHAQAARKEHRTALFPCPAQVRNVPRGGLWQIRWSPSEAISTSSFAALQFTLFACMHLQLPSLGIFSSHASSIDSYTHFRICTQNRMPASPSTLLRRIGSKVRTSNPC